MNKQPVKRRAVSPPAKSTGSKRVALDAYYTPAWVVRLCMEHVLPQVLDKAYPSTVIEPGCGAGVFVEGLRDTYGDAPRILAIDLDPRVIPCPGATWSLRGDYLLADVLGHADRSGGLVEFDLALGNPPYSLAQEFVHRSFVVARQTVLLLRQGFMSSAKRSYLFRQYPPIGVWNLANRPSFTGGSGDKADYSFVAWRRGWSGPTRLYWLPDVPLKERKV